MNQQTTTASPTNGATTAHDLFVLTDEQILEIEPEAADAAPVGQPFLAVQAQTAETASAKPSPESPHDATPENASQLRRPNAQPGMAVPPEPPPWLAAQMKDPWSGEEARELWNGVVQARQEVAAYRAAIASPEDARAFKELYPGGVNEARVTASRARLLDQIDQAYFGATSSTPEQTTASRAQLAAMMLREDPVAFREMVFAGLRALEAAEKGSSGAAHVSEFPRLAQVFAVSNDSPGSPAADGGPGSPGGASPAPTGTVPISARAPQVASHESPVSSHQSLPAAYAAFEKATNEDLERSVGATITHTIEQALPNLKASDERATVGARYIVPLHERLSAAVRQDVEAALKGDRQLGEQIAQILSARRFDNETRAQVVRLIDDRARQLVPSAARRVINEWTHATLAAHRGNAGRSDVASTRREVEPVAAPGPPAGQAGTGRAAVSSQAAETRSGARRVDYRKLSDEQILDL